jgi:hypothetical protein
MLQFLLLVLAFDPTVARQAVLTGPDPRPGPTPVTDKSVLAWQAGQCANWREEQRAMEQRIKGLAQDCTIKPKPRDAGRLDRSKPHP